MRRKVACSEFRNLFRQKYIPFFPFPTKGNNQTENKHLNSAGTSFLERDIKCFFSAINHLVARKLVTL